MLGFTVANLIIPDGPSEVALSCPNGMWILNRLPTYSEAKAAIADGGCAETFRLENGVSGISAAAEKAFGDLTPLLLGASYAVGHAVTIRRSIPGSEASILRPSNQWPRARGLADSWPVVATEADFQSLVVSFVGSWSSLGRTEKALLLVHHWLDALACWSLEDLYLSATTLLQIIVATEANKQGRSGLDFMPGVRQAARRFGIRQLSKDFKDMRNELIHDGRLVGRRFTGPDLAACVTVVADVMNWIDEYLHAALRLGPVRRMRFRAHELHGINAFSVN